MSACTVCLYPIANIRHVLVCDLLHNVVLLSLHLHEVRSDSVELSVDVPVPQLSIVILSLILVTEVGTGCDST